MRIATVFAAVPLFLAAPPATPPTQQSNEPTAVIDRELAAYNARNLDAFLAFYTPDAEIFEFPDKSLGKGKEGLRKRYEARFAEPNLHATIVGRMVIGDKVIDRERIVRTFPEGPGTWDVVAITEVKGGLITRAWFIIGEKRLDKPQ
jgi:hypothetical protein